MCVHVVGNSLGKDMCMSREGDIEVEISEDKTTVDGSYLPNRQAARTQRRTKVRAWAW
jgi:hypothetical protein